MIIGYVKGQNLSLQQNLIVADSIGYLSAQFVFMTNEWNGLTKVATFSKDGINYQFILDENNRITQDKQLNLTEGAWTVSLVGNESVNGQLVERITTDIEVLTVESSGVVGGEPIPIPESIGEQILAVAEQAKQTADSVRTDADEGKFNGKDGKDGKDGIDGADGPQGEKGDKGDKGEDGADGKSAGFGEITATVDDNTGTPSVEVITSGTDEAKNIEFQFHNLKGSGGGGGKDYTEILQLMKQLFEKAVYTEDVSSLIAKLEELLPSGGVVQIGDTLTIRSDVSAVQNSNTLTIS